MIHILAKLSAWQQTLSAGIILLLCAHMLYSGIVEPQWLRLTRTKAQLLAERNLVKVKKEAAAECKKLQTDLDSRLLQLKIIQDRCVAPEQPLIFFAELGTVAAKAGCRLKSVELYPEEKASVPPPVQIVNKKPATKNPRAPRVYPNGRARTVRRLQKHQGTIALTGTFPCVIGFLKTLNGSSNALLISRLSMNPTVDGSSTLSVRFMVTLFTLTENAEEAS